MRTRGTEFRGPRELPLIILIKSELANLRCRRSVNLPHTCCGSEELLHSVVSCHGFWMPCQLSLGRRGLLMQPWKSFERFWDRGGSSNAELFYSSQVIT